MLVIVLTCIPPEEPLDVFQVLPQAEIGTVEAAVQATLVTTVVVVIVMLAEVPNVSFLQLVADIV